MANTLNLGDGNWGVKDSSLLGYAKDNTKFVPETFDVTRASGGTRVNKDGLIETPAELGSEEVVNGDFATDSNWGKQAGWTISGGSANSNNGGSYKSISQSGMPFQVGKSYKVSCEVSNYVSGGIVFNVGGFNLSQVFTENGVHTEIIKASNASTNTYLYIESRSSGFEGSVDNVSVVEYNDENLARIDYLDSTKGVLLTEPQSTNLITESEDFSNSYWTKNNASVTNGFSSPSADSPLGAFKLVEDTSTGVHGLYKAGVTVTNSFSNTHSVYAKAGERSWIHLRNDNMNSASAYFDLTNGVVGNSDAPSSSIELLSNGWYKCSVTYTTSTTNSYPSVYLADENSRSYQGDGVSGVYIFGTQVEELSYATSYMPTYGQIASRAADVVNNGGDASNFNSEEGVLFVDVAGLSDGGGNRNISINNGTSSNQVSIYLNSTTGKITALISSNNVDAYLDSTGHNQLDFNKIALSYKNNDINLWINGVEVATNISQNAPIGLSSVSFANGGDGSPFYGKTKNIQVFNTVLTDEELYNLTSDRYATYDTMATDLNFDKQ